MAIVLNVGLGYRSRKTRVRHGIRHLEIFSLFGGGKGCSGEGARAPNFTPVYLNSLFLPPVYLTLLQIVPLMKIEKFLTKNLFVFIDPL